ncbi:hypothetical protein [Sphingobium mellinum]|uniref:hypothetical protein n=1 Tax=Sphingobium mellinum TaxID=1387166 RepID=UPI0030EEFE25
MPLGLAALDDLLNAFEALRAALDGSDPATIEAATSRIDRATTAARAIGAWRSDEAVKARLTALLPLLESARVRLNVLTDQAGQRLAILASHGSTHAPLTYRR